MGTVGINFGAATSGTGFDVATTVASITANLKAVETPWTTQLAALKSQDTAFTSLGTDLATLSTSLLALTDFQGVMASKQGASSDTNLLSLSSAGPTAVAGSHSVIITKLAQTSSEYTATVPTSAVLSGALTIQIGSGAPTTIPVVSGNSDTIASYASAINLAGIGVTASIISDTTGSRLSLVSNTSGAAGQLTVTSGGTVPAFTTPASTTNGVTTPAVTTPAATYGALTDTTAGTAGTAIAINTGLTGRDASLTVDGISVDSASNTISTAIPGVTFQLLASDPTTTIQVQIANDNADAETAFSTFITSFNAVVKDIATQEGNDSSGNPEPLYGNTVISQLQSTLSLALTSGAASGAIKSLDQLGITVNQDGTLALDNTTLDAVLNSNYQDVVGYLQNSQSFGLIFQNTLDQLGNQSPTGAITLALKANSSQEATFNNDVTQQDALIATQTASLTTELNAANEVLQAIPQQLDEMNELYSAMTGYNTGTNG
jgi:flagellar hook-associated protein 2